MARHDPGGHVSRSFDERGHVGNLAPAVSASRPRTTGRACRRAASNAVRKAPRGSPSSAV